MARRQLSKTANDSPASVLIITERAGNRHSPRRVQTQTLGDSLTKQSDRHEADINVILSRYIQTGDERHLIKAQGVFADVSAIGDYEACLEVVEEASEAFADLPANIREAYGNDPAMLIAAVLDPNEHKRLEELGVLTPKAAAKDAGSPPANKEEKPTA